MRSHFRSRAGGPRRYGLPLIAVVAVAATLVPAQAAQAAAPTPQVSAEDPEYPAPPTPGDLRDDPEIASVMQEADYALKYSMAVVAADPSKEFAKGSIEEDLRTGILTMPAERQKSAAEAARAMIADPAVRKREFGRFGGIEPEKYAQLGFHGVFTTENVPVDAAALKRRLTARATQIEAAHKLEEANALEMAAKYNIPLKLQIPTLTSLDYRIERVKCADETNPEWPGDDEIAMGGVAVNHVGSTAKVNQFMVADDFDDNEVKVYADPGKLFHRFDLTNAGTFPRTYSTVVMLAEKDGSGFADAINTVWSKVKDDVQNVIEKAVAGLLTGYLGAALAEAIGKAVAWLVTTFFSWLFELFQDDLFSPGTHYVYLPNRYEWMYKNAGDYGWTNFRAPTGTFTFNGHGGSYKVNVHWQVNP
ncbi:hypothetical protein [Actinophytocola oryzae]|uniref:Uncharacterized protein n=1 Tax=Actinophytocola oryzae TaxID=502181 RepID=A0A4R7V891_9PSEU|nr:hypothetical protein [Actinophytocola oryzae]TDV44306.1 hypothetical protein CLV71_114216 [Actinophytocola oryzae]